MPNHVWSLVHQHLRYYADFDPSGDFMVDDLIYRLGRIPGDKRKERFTDPNERRPSVLDMIDFQHIAVTKKQVHKFKLPSEIDEKTRQKLEGYHKPDGTYKNRTPTLLGSLKNMGVYMQTSLTHYLR